MAWSKRLVSLFAISLIVGLVSVGKAQVTTGTVSGTVTDPNGAVVTGASVQATSLETKTRREQQIPIATAISRLRFCRLDAIGSMWRRRAFKTIGSRWW